MAATCLECELGQLFLQFLALAIVLGLVSLQLLQQCFSGVHGCVALLLKLRQLSLEVIDILVQLIALGGGLDQKHSNSWCRARAIAIEQKACFPKMS